MVSQIRPFDRQPLRISLFCAEDQLNKRGITHDISQLPGLLLIANIRNQAKCDLVILWLRSSLRPIGLELHG